MKTVSTKASRWTGRSRVKLVLSQADKGENGKIDKAIAVIDEAKGPTSHK